jgi:hypothetical protein
MTKPFRAFEAASTKSGFEITQSYIRDSLRLDREVSTLIQDVEDILDLVKSSEEEGYLAQELIDRMPHPRALLILSSFMSVNQYPLFPETVKLVLDVFSSHSGYLYGRYLGDFEDKHLFNEDVQHCIECNASLSTIRIQSFSEGELLLNRAPMARNTYYLQDVEPDESPFQGIAIGKFGRKSLFEPIKTQFIDFPSSSNYSHICSELCYRYKSHGSEDSPPRGIMILNVTESTGRMILGPDIVD